MSLRLNLREPSPQVPSGKVHNMSRLGSGGSNCAVYSGVLTSGVPCVVKVLPKSSPLSSLEVSALRSVQGHPNVVHLLDTEEDSDKFYLIMERCESDLISTLEREPEGLSAAHVRSLFGQIVKAVSHCHSRGVYHGDIKPENVLLAFDGSIRLSDFGSASLRQYFKPYSLSPYYAAPEVFAAMSGVRVQTPVTPEYPDGSGLGSGSQAWSIATTSAPRFESSEAPGDVNLEKADIWSLAVLLYVMFTGSPPFDNASAKDSGFRKLARHQFSFPARIPRTARVLLTSMFQVNPYMRPSAVEVVQSSWLRGKQAVRAGGSVGLHDQGSVQRKFMRKSAFGLQSRTHRRPTTAARKPTTPGLSSLFGSIEVSDVEVDSSKLSDWDHASVGSGRSAADDSDTDAADAFQSLTARFGGYDTESVASSAPPTPHVSDSEDAGSLYSDDDGDFSDETGAYSDSGMPADSEDDDVDMVLKGKSVFVGATVVSSRPPEPSRLPVRSNMAALHGMTGQSPPSDVDVSLINTGEDSDRESGTPPNHADQGRVLINATPIQPASAQSDSESESGHIPVTEVEPSPWLLSSKRTAPAYVVSALSKASPSTTTRSPSAGPFALSGPSSRPVVQVAPPVLSAIGKQQSLPARNEVFTVGRSVKGRSKRDRTQPLSSLITTPASPGVSSRQCLSADASKQFGLFHGGDGGLRVPYLSSNMSPTDDYCDSDTASTFSAPVPPNGRRMSNCSEVDGLDDSVYLDDDNNDDDDNASVRSVKRAVSRCDLGGGDTPVAVPVSASFGASPAVLPAFHPGLSSGCEFSPVVPLSGAMSPVTRAVPFRPGIS